MLKKNIKIDRESMELISLFNNISGAIIKDCLVFRYPDFNSEVIIFLVKEEDVGKAIERERQQKELQERISRLIEQPIIPPTLPEEKREDSPISKLLLPLGTFYPKHDSLLLKPSEFNEPDIRWLDLIIPPSIV